MMETLINHLETISLEVSHLFFLIMRDDKYKQICLLMTFTSKLTIIIMEIINDAKRFSAFTECLGNFFNYTLFV